MHERFAGTANVVRGTSHGPEDHVGYVQKDARVMARGHDGCSAGGYTAQSLSQHLLINRRQTHERFVRDQHFWQASKRQS